MDDLTSQLINDNLTLWHLGAAMLLGALIGLERGWSKRKEEAGSRIAGIRTHALVGLLGGRSADADLGQVLRNRLTVVGTVLRARSPGEKLELTREFRKRVLPLIREGRLRPVVDRTFLLEDASEAHRYMESNRNLGKIVLEVGG